MSGLSDATQAAPDGFAPFPFHGPFAARVGPFYQCLRDDGRILYGFRAEARHRNAQDHIHGGALYSFADNLAGHAVVHATGRFCATLKLKVEFIAAAPVGAWIEGECTIQRVTRTLAFVRVLLRSGTRAVLSADGCFRLFGELAPRKRAGIAPQASAPAPAPDGYRPFRLQGEFPALYGPMLYRQDADGRYVCGLATGSGHDNGFSVVHGGVQFAFVDDLMGRAVAATSRRYASTIALDVSYLASVPVGGWLEGRADIAGLDEDHCYIRASVSHAGEAVLTADGIWRLFKRFDN